MKTLRLVAPSLALAALAVTPIRALLAQQADSLRLGAMHRQAVEHDPRQSQFQLLSRQADLRLRNLSAERLPSFTAEGVAQYQSDVFDTPAGLPGNLQFPSPSNDSYDARLVIKQPLIDPTIAPRQGVERAQLDESNARVRTELFGLKSQVNDAFFSAALLDERARVIAVTISDLESRLKEAAVRVREGAALPSDTAAIQATLLQRRQDQVELAADRRAALARLSQLVGRPIADGEHLALPELAGATQAARDGFDQLRSRPEFEEFARTRERLKLQEDVESSARKPQLSAFGRVGNGRPGLNPVNDGFDAYYVAGVQVTFQPFNWGRTARERQALAIQREIVAADEAAFVGSLTREVQNDMASIERLDTTLVMDDAIVALREQVENETRLRFREGVVTASEYLDRSTDVLEARLARAAHRVEQAEARARFLTTLGLEIR
jgi:outer membrane protein TolC